MSRDVTPGAAPSPPAIEIRQIAYSDETLAGLDPGFLRLDNRGNPRPDWWEYDPIRRHLLRHPPDAETFYGFLSPRFGAKTGLGAAEVVGFVAEAARPAPAGVAALRRTVAVNALVLASIADHSTFLRGLPLGSLGSKEPTRSVDGSLSTV